MSTFSLLSDINNFCSIFVLFSSIKKVTQV